MQPVNVFFSGRSERGTNVSQSVSCTINVNCPGMHKHMEGWEPGNTRPPWLSVRARIWKRTSSQLPESCSGVLWSSRTTVTVKFCVILEEPDITCWSLLYWSVMFIPHSVPYWVSKHVSCIQNNNWFSVSWSVCIGFTWYVTKTTQVFTIAWILLSYFHLIKNKTRYKSFIHKSYENIKLQQPVDLSISRLAEN